MFKKIKENIFIGDTKKLDKGFLKTCDAVTATLGAEGKFALLENTNTNLPPIVTKDGVSVMKNIRFSNKTENFGALQAIAGAAVTLQRAGDSTTTTASFMQGFLRNIKRSKFNKKVEKGIKLGLEEVNNWLDFLAKPTEVADLQRIIKTSVNNDDNLSKVIFEAFSSAGEEGVVEIVQNPNLLETSFTEHNGMYLDSHGYTSPHFINRDSKTCYEAENVAIICSSTYEKDTKIVQVIRNFYQTNDRNTPLVLFLERPNYEMDEELIKLKTNGCNVCVVATNGYDEYESENLLKDIGLLTQAKLYNPRDEKPECVLGLADKIVITNTTTTISVFETPSTIKEKIKTISDEKRLKRLKGKVVIIEVGGLNDLQRKEEFDRVEDAVASVKSSKAEGYIAGGGATLVYISNAMKKSFDNREIQLGYELVKKVLREPFIKILSNANRKTKTKWWHWYKDYMRPAEVNYGWGYNATTDEISNLFDDGVIDSKKSVKIAFQSATERAIQMFNIGVVVHFPEEMKL